MICEVILVVGTLFIIVFAFKLWEKTKDITFLVGIGMLYYFFLFGAWTIISVKTGNASPEIAAKLKGLEEEAFPIILDSSYAWTLSLYSVFIILVEAVLLLGTRNNRNSAATQYLSKPVFIDFWILILLGIICSIVSFLLVRGDLVMALAMNIPPYLYIRASNNPTFTLFQVFDGLMVLLSGWIIGLLLSNKQGRVCKARRVSIPQRVSIIILCMYILIFEWILGNRNNLLVALILGTLIYVYNSNKIKWLKLGFSSWFMLGLIGMIEPIRSTPMLDRWEYVQTNWDRILVTGFLGGTGSSESLAAHISLYGIIKYNAPLLYGKSLVSLVASVIPKFLWSDRPLDSYVYYSKSLRLPEEIGFTISHVSGWYLNFAVFGVILGAVCLGITWLTSYRYSKILLTSSKPSFRALGFVLPLAFSAGIAPLCRGGPEAYKSMVMGIFMIWLVAGIGVIKIKSIIRL